MTISVIIATRNRATLLHATLERLRHQQYEPDDEVIVVDNASTDATADVVARRALPGFRCASTGSLNRPGQDPRAQCGPGSGSRRRAGFDRRRRTCWRALDSGHPKCVRVFDARLWSEGASIPMGTQAAAVVARRRRRPLRAYGVPSRAAPLRRCARIGFTRGSWREHGIPPQGAWKARRASPPSSIVGRARCSAARTTTSANGPWRQDSIASICRSCAFDIGFRPSERVCGTTCGGSMRPALRRLCSIADP